LPDDSFREKWDLFIALLVVYISIVTPFRLAFIDDDSKTYEIFDNIINAFFALDMIFNFFMAYFDAD
jgi:hypothetical protein